jgi:hypothetical protein
LIEELIEGAQYRVAVSPIPRIEQALGNERVDLGLA